MCRGLCTCLPFCAPSIHPAGLHTRCLLLYSQAKTFASQASSAALRYAVHSQHSECKHTAVIVFFVPTAFVVSGELFCYVRGPRTCIWSESHCDYPPRVPDVISIFRARRIPNLSVDSGQCLCKMVYTTVFLAAAKSMHDARAATARGIP